MRYGIPGKGQHTAHCVQKDPSEPTLIVDGLFVRVEAMGIPSKCFEERRAAAAGPAKNQEHLSRLDQAIEVVQNLHFLPWPASEKAHSKLWDSQGPRGDGWLVPG